MSKFDYCTRHRPTKALQSHTPGGADPTSDKPARRDRTDGRHLLDRILNTPRLEQVVPRLQPDLLHRLIQNCGLEDCGELVALATPEQLTHIFDLDLWHASRPSLDEQFNAARFGLWLEVLVEIGAAVAAHKLVGMDVGLVVTGLAQHILVFDRAAVMPYETLDGEQVDLSHAIDDGLTSEVGGYVLVARRADSWEAIVDALMALDTGHPDYFHQVMGKCRSLSDSGRELDGLDDLLAESDQAMFDMAVDREGRREKQGYVTPAQARAFLQMSRQLRLGSAVGPPANPLARAYFRDLDEGTEVDIHSESRLLAAGTETLPASEDNADDVAAVFNVLLEAGIIEQSPRALLGRPEGQSSRLGRIQTHMQFVLDRDPEVYLTRSEELAYLANTLIAGCSIQARSFTAQEASDAAVAVCNLGMENWPPHWLPVNVTALPGDFLVEHDLISVFQVGWAILYRNISLYAAEQLMGVLTLMQCADREIQAGLDTLHIEMAKYWQAGTPWRAQEALDIIALLDQQAWAVLVALIDECPVLHASLAVPKGSRPFATRVSDFEFISENSQIMLVREFMQSLAETLRY